MHRLLYALLKHLSPPTCLKILTELLILLNRLKLLLNILNLLDQPRLHDSQISLESVREVFKQLDTIALLLRNLHRPSKGLPYADILLLSKLEEVVVEDLNFTRDSCNQTINLQSLVLQILDELLSLCDLFDILVVRLSNDLEHVVHLVMDLLLAPFDLLLDLLKQNFIESANLVLQALLEVAHPDDNWPNVERILKEQLIDLVPLSLVILQDATVLLNCDGIALLLTLEILHFFLENVRVLIAAFEEGLEHFEELL